MKWIQGDKFKTLAKYQYAPDAPEEKSVSAYDNLQNTLDIKALEDMDIIYTHKFYVRQLFQLIRDVYKRLILITHNSDCNIDDTYLLPENIIVWHTQNVNTINPRIQSIPIGLENDRWFPQVQKKSKMLEKLKERQNIRNLVYMNHNITTNPIKRLHLYELFKNRVWVTSARGVNGEGFDEYLDNIYNHDFVICPEGNGMDTHRTWECLYMNTIPIEKRNINNQFYTDLPICFVDEWEEVTEDFLKSEWQRINSTNWNYEKLDFKYWEKWIGGI